MSGGARRAIFVALVGLSACGGSGAARPDGGDGAADLPSIVASDLVPRTTECETDADCPSPGAVCAAVVPNGYRACVSPGREATAPSPSVNQCDPAHPCATGKCWEGLYLPTGPCGLGGASSANVCEADQCASDADCAGGICGPAGLTSDDSTSGAGVRECFAASCHSNADCVAHPGGVCALIDSACTGPHVFVRAQIACVYPGGCFGTSDCRNGGGTCLVVGGAASCVQ